MTVGQGVRTKIELSVPPQTSAPAGVVGIITQVAGNDVEVTVYTTRGLKAFWVTRDDVEVI